MKNNMLNMLSIIRASLWGTSENALVSSFETFEEFRFHALLALPASILSDISMEPELKQLWKKEIIKQLSYNTQNQYVQNHIKLNVPYVILKGTSAAQYYPHPEFRTMGDIDIMTRKEDFDKAHQQLLDGGYHVIQNQEREICFGKNGVVIELHKFFASLNDPQKAELLDNTIIESINPSHILPDMVNGIVLLEHISQHLEHGIGLRQIIDWMMFVNKCLTDDRWKDFEQLSEKVGMKKLALIVTKTCEMYLGLSEREWTEKMDENICESFMEYVLSCGNFGSKWTNDSDKRTTVFSYIRGPISTFKWLQERGRENWKAVQKHAFLRPFAWIYQAGRSISKGFGEEVFGDYKKAKQRIMMFDELGVKQRSKGLVIYKDGQYKKK